MSETKQEQTKQVKGRRELFTPTIDSRVWKYQLKETTTTVTMPVGSTILAVALTDEWNTVTQKASYPTIWVQHQHVGSRDGQGLRDRIPLPSEERTFYSVCTGQPFPLAAEGHQLEYIGTTFNTNDNIVLHVYEDKGLAEKEESEG